MSDTSFSSTQLRGYRVLKALFGHELNGISCQRIADGLGQNKVAALRDLQTLEAAGMAEQLPNKNWRVSAELGRQAVKMLNHIQSQRARMDETARRYGVDV